MGEFFRKQRFAVFAVILLGVLFFGSRMYHLTSLPIFTDEAIYIRWSQIGSRDANWRFISLTDGKQPLFTWILMIFLKGIHNPLFAGRFVSVVAGFGGMIGMFFLGNELFRSKRIGFFGSVMYVLSPFTLMYDRMALYDSLVGVIAIWCLYLAIRLVRSPQLDTALLFGFALGAGMLNKTSGFLNLYMAPLTLLIFSWNGKDKTKRLFRWIFFLLIAAVLSQILYSVLRLSPFFHIVSQKDNVFVFSFREWIREPFRYLEGNLRGMLDWTWRYLTVPVCLLLIGFMTFFHRYKRETLFLFLWWFAPFVLLANFGKVLYPRFILFMTMPLLLMTGVACYVLFSTRRRQMAGIVCVAFIFFSNILVGFTIVSDPARAMIPDSDKGQYVNDWPAGWGIREVNTFLLRQASIGKIVVYTEGTFGLLPYAVEIDLVDNPDIEIHGIWPLPKTMPEDMAVSSRRYPTYLILNRTQIPPQGWPLELLAAYQKGINKDVALRLMKVTPLPVLNKGK